MRRIVDALKDLGEKVTGKPIEVTDENLMLYGEDLTEILDEITENYEAGGGGGNTAALLNTNYTVTEGEVTDEEDIETLNGLIELAKNKQYPLPNIYNYGDDYCVMDYIANVYIDVDGVDGFITGSDIRIEKSDDTWTISY